MTILSRNFHFMSIVKAFLAIVFVAILIVGIFSIIGHPEWVSWWRAEYLIGGFTALLIGAVIRAIRTRKSSKISEETPVETTITALFKGAGVVFTAILLMLITYLLVMY